MENKQKNGFLITWISCIVILLVLCFFGVSKGTYSGYCSGVSGISSEDECKSEGGVWIEDPGDSDDPPSGGGSDDEKVRQCTSGQGCFNAAGEYGIYDKSKFCSYSNGVCSCSPELESLSKCNDATGVVACWKCGDDYKLSTSIPASNCVAAAEGYCTGNPPSNPKVGNTCGLTNYGFWTYAQCEADPTNVWSISDNGDACCDVNKATLDPDVAVVGYVCGKDPTKKVYDDADDCVSHGYVWDCNNNCCDVNRVVDCDAGECLEPGDPPGGNPPGGNPGSGNSSSPSSPSSSSNVDDNPKTGEIAMFMIWVIGFGAVGYSIWYYVKNRKES